MTDEDKRHWGAIKALLREGKFELQGSAIAPVVLALGWFENDLPRKLQVDKKVETQTKKKVRKKSGNNSRSG